MQRLWNGVFECPDCDIEYEADGDLESDLVCEECGDSLVPVKEEQEDDDEEDAA
jgi:hypothetical protein